MRSSFRSRRQKPSRNGRTTASAQPAILASEKSPNSAFWITDFAFEHVVYVSRGFEKLWGRPCATLYADPRSLFETVHPVDRARVIEHYARQKQGVPLDQEYRIVRPDGSVRWIWDRRSPMGDDSEQVYAGVAQDITDQKLAEQVLARHDSVVQSASEAIFSTNLEGVITAWNPAAETLFGYSGKDAIGASVMLIAPPEHAEQEIRLLERLADGEEVGVIETQRRRRNGIIFDVALTVSPLRESGTIVGAAIICRDITREKAARSALLESERCFRETFDVASLGLAHASVDGQVVRVNRRLCALTGFEPETLLQRTLQEIVDSDDRAIDAVQIGDLIMGRSDSYTVEKRLLRRNEFPIWSRFTISAARRSDGVPNYLIVEIQDISEKHQLESQLRQAQKMETIGQLASGLAHDFNNVLGYVTMRAELTSTYSNLPPNVLQDLQQIKAAANRATHVTRQLLALTRNEQASRPQRLDINELIGATTKMIQRLLGEAVTLDIALIGHPVIVNLDPGVVDQVLLNLAVNARDAMPSGGSLMIETTEFVVPDLASRPSPEVAPGNYVCLRVADTGIGIAPENMPRIFAPFFTTKEPGRGTGLGLTMVANLVRQHRGWITVESEYGRGATFRVYLPTADVGAAAIDIPASAAASSGSETILLVEDEADLRITARMVLQLKGYRVLEAATGLDALTQWARHKDEIDLVFTDMVLPDGTGGRAVAERAQSEKPEVKVIFTTGYSPDIAGGEFVLHDGRNFLPKPYSIEHLLSVVQQSLHPARE